jgi:hypothetical protein
MSSIGKTLHLSRDDIGTKKVKALSCEKDLSHHQTEIGDLVALCAHKEPLVTVVTFGHSDHVYYYDSAVGSSSASNNMQSPDATAAQTVTLSSG